MVHESTDFARSSTRPQLLRRAVRTRTHRRTDQTGSSLLEVIIAVFLVSMVVLGLAAAFLTLMRVNRANSEQQRVDHAVDNVAEQLKAVPYAAAGDRLAAYTAALGLAPVAGEPTVTLTQVECRVRSTIATPANSDTYDGACVTDGGTQRVTVRGEWRGRSRQAQVVVRNR